MQQYRNFVFDQFGLKENAEEDELRRKYLEPFLSQLTQVVHPLALGNVHRVHKQIQQLAENILGLQEDIEVDVDRTVKALTQEFYSHMHMINRDEASTFLGERVVGMEEELATQADALLRQYQETFKFSEPFFLAAHMKDELSKDVRFVGGVLESTERSYLFITEAVITQRSEIPNNVTIQLAQDQKLPLIPGLPRSYDIQVTRQSWMHNEKPQGVTT